MALDELKMTGRGRIRRVKEWRVAGAGERPAAPKNARAGCPRTSGRDARATSRGSPQSQQLRTTLLTGDIAPFES